MCLLRIEFQIRFDNGAFMLTQGTIRDAVEDSITWPVRKVIPIIPGDYRYEYDLEKCANWSRGCLVAFAHYRRLAFF